MSQIVEMGKCPTHGWTTEMVPWEEPEESGYYCGVHTENEDPYDHQCGFCEEPITEIGSFILAESEIESV